MTAARLPAIVMLFLLAACSGGEPPEASSSPSMDPATASPTPAAVVDPAEQPSIDDAFAVTAGGRQLRLMCWGRAARPCSWRPEAPGSRNGRAPESSTNSPAAAVCAPTTVPELGEVTRRPTSDGTPMMS